MKNLFKHHLFISLRLESWKQESNSEVIITTLFPFHLKFALEAKLGLVFGDRIWIFRNRVQYLPTFPLHPYFLLTKGGEEPGDKDQKRWIRFSFLVTYTCARLARRCSRWGHRPAPRRLWVWSPLGAYRRQPIHASLSQQCFFLSLHLSLKINKNVLEWGLKIRIIMYMYANRDALQSKESKQLTKIISQYVTTFMGQLQRDA